MRQVDKSRSRAAAPAAAPAADRMQTATAEVSDSQTAPVAPAESAAGYSADDAAIAFGILRIAPVASHQPIQRTSQPGAPAPIFPGSKEDHTESLTADEQQAEVDFAEHALPDLEALPEFADPAVEEVLSDQVTGSLRLPDHRDRAARPAWGGTQRPPLTERLAVPPSFAPPPIPDAPRLGQRQTAVLPHLGRSHGEATTTVTLPPTPGNAAPFEFAATEPSPLRLAKWVLFGVGALLSVLLAALAGRALTLADLWPSPALHPTPPAPRPAYRERLLEQAVAALRDGRREQAVGLLLRYQASEPAGGADHTVELMLRVLKKDLGTARPYPN